MFMKDVAALRKEIERIDSEIVELMKQRNDVAKEIGDIKAELGLPLRNLDVENEVIARYRKMAKDSLLPEDVSEAVCRILIKSSVELQSAALRGRCAKNVTIVGGTGKMGRWLQAYLEGMGASVKALSSKDSLDGAKDADVVIVSVPISMTQTIMERCDRICRKDSLMFDVASVKSPFAKCLKEMAKRRKVCSVHPMFGPSARSMLGRNVVVCDCGRRDAVDEAAELFGNDGSNLIYATIERHDELMAYVLAFAHATNITFLAALRESGISFGDLKEAASTTFERCMRTFIPVSEEDPVLYHQIQRLNANAESMWRTYEKAFGEVKEASLSADPGKFVTVMEKGRGYLDGKDV